jgi:UDP-N-acetylmuramoylalanine--D-glutamate ligase
MVPSFVMLFSPSGQDADVMVRDHKVYVHDRLLWDLTGNPRFLYPPYLEDLLGALSALIALGYEKELREITSESLSDFVFARHRMEEVATIGGVIFINDSKATNVASTIAAIKGFEGSKLLLILGGSKKDTSYDELAEEIKRLGVKYIALIGETSSDIKSSLDKIGYSQYELVDSLEDAVTLLWKKAQPGDTVLLSPACASFDMFNNYKHRGDTFVEIVNRLAKEYD